MAMSFDLKDYTNRSVFGSDYSYTLQSRASTTPPTTSHINGNTASFEVSPSIGSGATVLMSFITEAGFPGTETWSTSGTEVVDLFFSATYSDLDIRTRLRRIEGSNTVKDTGSWTSYQTVSSTNLTFNPVKPTWGTVIAVDRLILDIEWVDTRGHGGASTYTFIHGAEDASSTGSTSFFTTQIEGPDSSSYDTQFFTTDDASDLSTYTDNNYELNTTGEAGSTTINFTSLGDTDTKEIGWITPSGTPNNAAFEDGLEGMRLELEIKVDNVSTASASTYTRFGLSIDRISSGGTVLQSSNVKSYRVKPSSTGTGGSYETLGISVSNAISWTSGSTTDRIGLTLTLDAFSSGGITQDVSIRVHDGTSQTSSFYSKIVDSTAGGTTTFKTITFTGTGAESVTKIPGLVKVCAATGTEALTRNIGFTKTYAGTGTETVVKQIETTKTHSATGTSTFAKALMNLLTLVYTGTGTQTAVKNIGKTLSSSATGTAVLTRIADFYRTLSAAATGTSTVVKNVGKTLSQAATGTNTFAKTLITTILKSVSAAGIGTSSLAKKILTTIAVSAVGTNIVSEILIRVKTLAIGASGTLGTLKNIGKTLSSSATGALSITKSIGKALVYVAAGAAGFAKGLLDTMLFSIGATGTSSITKQIETTLSIAASGAATLTKGMFNTIAMVATGAVNIIKGIAKTHVYAASGAVTFAKGLLTSMVLTMSAIGTSSIAKKILTTISMAAAGTAALIKANIRVLSLAYTALGTSAVTKKILTTISMAATGTSTFLKGLLDTMLLSITATGTSVLTETACFDRVAPTSIDHNARLRRRWNLCPEISRVKQKTPGFLSTRANVRTARALP